MNKFTIIWYNELPHHTVLITGYGRFLPGTLGVKWNIMNDTEQTLFRCGRWAKNQQMSFEVTVGKVISPDTIDHHHDVAKSMNTRYRTVHIYYLIRRWQKSKDDEEWWRQHHHCYLLVQDII